MSMCETEIMNEYFVGVSTALFAFLLMASRLICGHAE